MTKITESTLRKMVREEASKIMKEANEPDAQIISSLMADFKRETGIVAPEPKFYKAYRDGKSFAYTSSLSKEIKSPIFENLLKELNLEVSVKTYEDTPGKYYAVFSYEYTHPNGGSNGYTIGTMWYENGKFHSYRAG